MATRSKKNKEKDKSKVKTAAVTTLPEGVVPFRKYEIAKIDPKVLGDMMKEAFSGLDLSEFDLDRIVVPTGGGPAWEIRGVDADPEVTTHFDGVILGYANRRAYYAVSFDESGGGSPPDCSSNDCVVGKGDPGGSCEACQLAQFGSSEKPGGRGQACNQNMILFVVRDGDLMPSVIKVPPTSIKAVKQYVMRLIFKKRTRYCHALTRFSLAKEKNRNGVGYSSIVLQFLGSMDNGEKAAADKLHNGMAPLVKGLKATSSAFLPAPEAETERLMQPEEAASALDEPQGAPEADAGVPDVPQEQEAPETAQEAPEEPSGPQPEDL